MTVNNRNQIFMLIWIGHSIFNYHSCFLIAAVQMQNCLSWLNQSIWLQGVNDQLIVAAKALLFTGNLQFSKEIEWTSHQCMPSPMLESFSNFKNKHWTSVSLQDINCTEDNKRLHDRGQETEMAYDEWVRSLQSNCLYRQSNYFREKQLSNTSTLFTWPCCYTHK